MSSLAPGGPRGARFLNLACGASYVDGGPWLNLDYTPAGPGVRRADLLGELPVASGSIELVYSSHFFEHVPRPRLPGLFQECRRVLKPGGLLRVVVPDFQEMCDTYLRHRSHGDHRKADYLMFEILDQCIRKAPGGELAALYADVAARRDDDLAGFIQERCGEPVMPQTQARATVQPLNPFARRLRRALERRYIHAVCALLPRAFREQNVSLAEVGETHAWLYDFHSLAQGLAKAGFSDCTKMAFNTSRHAEFPCLALDATAAGRPRKGAQSMYLEAIAV